MNIEQVDSRPLKSVALTEFVLSKDTTCKNQAICIGRRSLISYPGEIQTRSVFLPFGLNITGKAFVDLSRVLKVAKVLGLQIAKAKFSE